MSPDTLIYFAIAVFALMIVGLALTYLEFRKLSPKKQQTNIPTDRSVQEH